MYRFVSKITEERNPSGDKNRNPADLSGYGFFCCDTDNDANQLTDGLEKLMRPLNKIKVPVHEIAMMMSIALRFIPILMEETDKIMKAQIARGADFESGNLIKKAKNLIPLLVPLFISAFRRADDLAMAMEARCYHGGDHRTSMKPLKYQKHDIMAYLILLVYLIADIVLRIIV